MNREVSRASSSKTFWTSESIWASSSDSWNPSSIISSVISALAISLRMSSIVCCNSGMFMSWFISFMIAPEVFRADAVDMDAVTVVRCRLTACMEHFVRSSRAIAFLLITTCLASVLTLPTCPLSAMAVISFLSFTSSWRMRLTSRSRRRCSDRSCLCHSRALSFTVSSFDGPPPMLALAQPPRASTATQRLVRRVAGARPA
mmetsp:Transcript_27027/g.59461  ORF Transcript_27027/g.59461 Transcript_27027/m.59461 type:complete len:202 (-) Transcript_27027:18-623(-)